MIITPNRRSSTQKMATFNSTRKKYPNRWEKGQVWYNTLCEISQGCIDEYSILNNNFHLTEFYTEAQKKFHKKQLTWCWTKCHLSALTCKRIIEANADLRNAIEHYALITHDKDEGEPHTHMLIKFHRNEHCHSRLLDAFHIDYANDCSNLVGVKFNYLTHNSQTCRKEGKFQYSKDEIITDSLSFFENYQAPNENALASGIVDDIINGKSERYLVSTYGRDYIFHRQQYHNSARLIMAEENLRIAQGIIIKSITDECLALYNEQTGELLEIARNYNQIKGG